MKKLTGILAFLLLLTHGATPQSSGTVAPLVDLPSGYLLGGSHRGRWIKDKETTALLKSKTNFAYRIYSPTRLLQSVTGTRPFSQGAPCEETQFVQFLHKPKDAAFAIGGNWNALPRVPRIEKGNSATYRAIVAQILRQKGIARPKVQIEQLWRVDLDGDGAQEVLLTATRKNSVDAENISPDARAGDYSLVLLRRVTPKGVTTQVLAGEFYTRAKKFNAPSFFRIGAVLDANGDGKMEILMRARYYEGDSAGLYDGSGQKVDALLDSGCGA